MNDIKISIIVPVYNSAFFLQKCIESIINQTYHNWELILINDGSTDSSSSICNNYINDKIKVIHKKNEGVSKARNEGLNHATGDYITFADSDDYLEERTFEIYVNEIHTNNTDIVKVGYFREMQNSSQAVETVSTGMNYIFTNTWDFHRTLEHSHYYSFLWNMCIKKECIANIRFDESINWCEDHIFSYQCYFNCKTMSILSNVCYHYQIHTHGSLSNIKNPYIIKAASEKELYWKTKLNSGIYKDIQKETENEYCYRLHTIVRLLYIYHYSFKEKYNLSLECQVPRKLIYKEEKIFFYKKIPFIVRNVLLKTIFYYKTKRHSYN